MHLSHAPGRSSNRGERNARGGRAFVAKRGPHHADNVAEADFPFYVEFQQAVATEKEMSSWPGRGICGTVRVIVTR